MSISEITLEELNAEEFIEKQVSALSSAVGDAIAINALSGGVDSSVVTLLGHRAFGDRLKTYFIDNGLMRKDESRGVVARGVGGHCPGLEGEAGDRVVGPAELERAGALQLLALEEQLPSGPPVQRRTGRDRCPVRPGRDPLRGGTNVVQPASMIWPTWAPASPSPGSTHSEVSRSSNASIDRLKNCTVNRAAPSVSRSVRR